MKKIIIILLFLISYPGIYAQIHNKAPFCLYDVTECGDINYRGIDSINSVDAVGRSMLNTVFNTVDGDYTIYRFMSYTCGWNQIDSYEELNDIVVLKVDSARNIIEGFYYYLQYPNMPISCALYHTDKKIKLKDKIKMKDLQFELYKKGEFAQYRCHKPKKLKDNRTLYIKKYRMSLGVENF